MADTTAGIEQHPDLVELREKYDRAAARPVAQVIDGLTFLAGLYLALSPWILGFDGLTPLAVSNLVTGLAVAALAMGFVSAFGRVHGVAFVAPLLGVWAIVSPWVISGDMSTTTTVLSNVIVGGACVLLGLGAMSFGMARRRRRR
ncbi:MAG: SPW repeat protein [Actinocatenispora sp.]